MLLLFAIFALEHKPECRSIRATVVGVSGMKGLEAGGKALVQGNVELSVEIGRRCWIDDVVAGGRINGDHSSHDGMVHETKH